MIEFGEWLPDLPLSTGGASTKALNVYSAGIGYLEFPSFSVLSSALAERARGAEAFLDESSNIFAYVGTETNLYEVSSTPTEVSRVGDAYATTTENNWEFVKWGNKCLATNYNDEIQIITFGASNFADLSGSPPNAAHIAVVKDFIILGNVDDVSYRVAWSAFGDETGWTSGTDQSGTQDLLGGGGAIIKVVGGDYGIIFQERSIQRMDYVGTPLVFTFTEVEPGRGAWMPGGVVQYGRSTYYISKDGFYELIDGSYSKSIGHEKINRYFLNDIDASYLSRVTSTVDVARNSIIWCYPGAGNSSGTPNHVIIYNFRTGRFTQAEFEVDVIYRGLSLGYTLEELDDFGTIDTLPASLDSSTWKGGEETLSGFDTSFRYGTFTNTALTAMLETEEVGGETRLYVSEVRPFIEGGSPTVQVGSRDTLMAGVTWDAAQSVDSEGKVNVSVDKRYLRIRVNIAGGFDSAVGVDIDSQPAGK